MVRLDPKVLLGSKARPGTPESRAHRARPVRRALRVFKAGRATRVQRGHPDSLAHPASRGYRVLRAALGRRVPRGSAESGARLGRRVCGDPRVCGELREHLDPRLPRASVVPLAKGDPRDTVGSSDYKDYQDQRARLETRDPWETQDLLEYRALLDRKAQQVAMDLRVLRAPWGHTDSGGRKEKLASQERQGTRDPLAPLEGRASHSATTRRRCMPLWGKAR